ncbi:uncharacterized protein LOC119298620 [Triticum dicoccoides]|uniref:uncharacterized protein LOC119298620 n=1 Tax=Triticum dicoccoides TaxID=85692 RepID=UPI00188FC447|nr:uncharacterized protein LOC119298620 [Triticum dicoccoides]
MCTEMSHAVGKFVIGLGKLDEEEPGTSRNMDNPPHATEQHSSRRKRATPKVTHHNSSEDEESFKSDEESEDEDESEDKESESSSDNSGDGSEDGGLGDDDDDDDDSHQGGNVSHSSAEEVDEDTEETHKSKENKDDNDDTMYGGNDSGTQCDEGHKHQVDAQRNREADDDETEEDDEAEDGQEHVEEGSAKRNDDGNRDDEDHYGGGNVGGYNRNNTSDGDEGGGSSSSSKDDDSASNFRIKLSDGKQQGGALETFSLRDMVRMEFKKKWDPFRNQLETPKVWDGRNIQSYTNLLFQQMLLNNEEKEVGIKFNHEEICPPKARKELMQEICGIKQSEPNSRDCSHKVLPPMQPRKQKRVSFNLVPKPAVPVENRQLPKALISALKPKGQTQKVQEATEVTKTASLAKGEATCMVMQASQNSNKAGTADLSSAHPGTHEVKKDHFDKIPKLFEPMTLGEKSKQASPMENLPTTAIKSLCSNPQRDTLPGSSGNQASKVEVLPTRSTHVVSQRVDGKQIVPDENLPRSPADLPTMTTELAREPNIGGNQTQPEDKLPRFVTQLPARSQQLATSPTSGGNQTVCEQKLCSPIVDLPARSPQAATTEKLHRIEKVMPPRSDVTYLGPVAKLLKTNLTLPSTQLQGDALTEIFQESQAVDLLSYDLNFPSSNSHCAEKQVNDANKEKCPSVPHHEQNVDTVKINEILAKCAVPTDAHIHIAGRRIVEESTKELQSTRVSGTWDEYCPAPSFGLILEELEPGLEERNKESIHLQGVLDAQAGKVATTSTTETINLENDEWDA